MSAETGGPEAAMAERLGEAVAGLVYSSESDRPFTVFFRAAAEVPAPLTAASFAALVGASADDPVEERPFERFLARHIDHVDPADTAAWSRVPRYDALQRLLSGLRDPRFFRIGRVEVRCFGVGRDAAGNLVGVATTAVET